MQVKILCIGDIVGQIGRTFLAYALPVLRHAYDVDLVIANAENSAGGSGLTPNIFSKLQRYGVDVVTLGDHCYRREDIMPTLQSSEPLVRPANYPPGAVGKPFVVATGKGGEEVGVTVVLGRLYMKPADCPFRTVDQILPKMKQQTKISVVEIHAEATSEKVAMGWHLDGRASIVFGTHTHIPTADSRILPGGTAYITDLGMTGPYDSVLGRTKEKVLKSLITGMPNKFSIAEGGLRVGGILVSVDSNTGKSTEIEQVFFDRAQIDEIRREYKKEMPDDEVQMANQ